MFLDKASVMVLSDPFAVYNILLVSCEMLSNCLTFHCRYLSG